jgi:hypothetical protein
MASESWIRIIDSARSVTAAAATIKQSGIATVIRYYAREGGQWCGKVLGKSELDALDAAELSVAVVFQHNNNQADYFYDEEKKKEDVKWALNHAQDLKQPTETPIYFGADFDLGGRRKKDSHGNFIKDQNGDYVIEYSDEIQHANEAAILNYFRYAREELGKKNYKVGVYGCGATCELLGGDQQRPKLADYFWISASVSYKGTSRFYNSRNWHLFQNKVELPRTDFIPKQCRDEYGRNESQSDSSRVIDTDVLNDRFEDFGQWRKDGSRPAHPSVASKLVLQNRAFSQVASAKIHAQPSEGSAGIGRVLYARNARILERTGDYVAVTVTESDQILGYCKRTGLTSDMSVMPDWPQTA